MHTDRIVWRARKIFDNLRVVQPRKLKITVELHNFMSPYHVKDDCFSGTGRADFGSSPGTIKMVDGNLTCFFLFFHEKYSN